MERWLNDREKFAMFDIKSRSRQEEILDNIDLEEHDLAQNLRELAVINRVLGGHKIVINTLQEIFEEDPKRKWKVADLGCGGGDVLAAIAKSKTLQKYEKELVGVDKSQKAINFSKNEHIGIPGLRFQQADLLLTWPKQQFDVVFFNLVLHHFSDQQIISLLQKAARHSRFIIINDLQRNWLPYHLFRLVSRIFQFSKISRHDGKLSVKKSFTKKDWERLLNKAQQKNFKIEWRWAFRWVAVIDTKQEKNIDHQDTRIR